MTAILSCRNLVKSFASEPPLIVLDHLSADFHENEICAITGMSGKGKSTLLAILGGTAKPDSGTVDFMGKQIHRFPQTNSTVSIAAALASSLKTHSCSKRLRRERTYYSQLKCNLTSARHPSTLPLRNSVSLTAPTTSRANSPLARSADSLLPALFLGGIASSSPTSRRTTLIRTGRPSFSRSSNLSHTKRAMLSSP